MTLCLMQLYATCLKVFLLILLQSLFADRCRATDVDHGSLVFFAFLQSRMHFHLLFIKMCVNDNSC